MASARRLQCLVAPVGFTYTALVFFFIVLHPILHGPPDKTITCDFAAVHLDIGLQSTYTQGSVVIAEGLVVTWMINCHFTCDGQDLCCHVEVL